ncbi:hypothetical protein TWF103_008966 [Orbilia oligospora]|uniref:Uncharacterized protein n=1 Tax=Orbilia oligospora TaxID=2813651 RepID=A0A7C8NQF2_ORBOL|nr:hypothetical protein TWF103_008966 [Orbilia oligospora]KAF3135792.1 hypothetical protein TWF703_005887 [Orbilia oligospora]
MFRNAFDRSNIPLVQTSMSASLTDETKVDENGEREEVRFVDSDIEDAYQNEGDAKRINTKDAQFEPHGTRSISSVEVNGTRPAASSVTAFAITGRSAQNSFVLSREATMHKWGLLGEDIPKETPKQVRKAMLSLESLVRQSEDNSSAPHLHDLGQNNLTTDHEAEARRLLASPKTSPQLLDKVDQIPFVPIARSRVSQLRQGIDNSNLLNARLAPVSSSERQLKYRTDDAIRTASGSSRPSNFALSGHQYHRSASRFGPRSASSSGLTADEFMAVIHRSPSRSNSRTNVTSPSFRPTFMGRNYSQKSSAAVDQIITDLASQSELAVYPFNSASIAPRRLGHSVNTIRRHGIRLRSFGMPSDQDIIVAKGRRGPVSQEDQPDAPAVSIKKPHDLSFLPKEGFDPAKETPAETSTRKERTMLAYFIHTGVSFADDEEVRKARFQFQRIWEDCRLGPTAFEKPCSDGEITDWI